MKLYRTKENNVINLEQVTMVYRDPDSGLYRVSFTNGLTYEMPEIGADDIDRFIEYNEFLIN